MKSKVSADHLIPGGPQKCFKAIAAWQQKRNGWLPDTEHMAFAPGVAPGMRMMLTMFTQPGDRILIQQPVYHPFADVVNNTGRELVASPLKRDENGYYTMDLADFEEDAKYFILCNPYNPEGRYWSPDELKWVGGSTACTSFPHSLTPPAPPRSIAEKALFRLEYMVKSC